MGDSFQRLCLNDSNSFEIDDVDEVADVSIAFGSISLSKSDMNIYFSCFSCGIEVQDFEDFLTHSFLHHMDLNANDLATVLSKIRKQKDKPSSVSKGVVLDSSSKIMDFLEFEEDSSEDNYQASEYNDVRNEEKTEIFIEKYQECDEITEPPSSGNLDNCDSFSQGGYVSDADLIEDTSDSIDLSSNKIEDFELVIIQPNLFPIDGNAVKSVNHGNVSTKRTFHCKICDKSIERRCQYVLHMKRHHEIKPYVCEFCDARFPDSSNWKVHRQRHLGIKPHRCTLCEKSFTSTTELKRHNITHTGERPFTCLECGKLYRTAAQLNYHRRRHTNDRRFVCATCGKRFYEMQLLRDHEVSHSTERPFVCEICEMRFSRNKALREHAKLHSDVKNYACKLCPRAFAQCAGLHSHMKTHLPRKPDRTKLKAPKDVSNSDS